MKPFKPPSQEREDELGDLVVPITVPRPPFVLLEDAVAGLPVAPPPIPVDYFEDPYC